jgi:hypothetical protein
LRSGEESKSFIHHGFLGRQKYFKWILSYVFTSRKGGRFGNEWEREWGLFTFSC